MWKVCTVFLVKISGNFSEIKLSGNFSEIKIGGNFPEVWNKFLEIFRQFSGGNFWKFPDSQP